MTLSSPTKNVFLIAAILAIVSVVSRYVSIQYVSANAYWILLAAWIVLALGCLMRKL